MSDKSVVNEEDRIAQEMKSGLLDSARSFVMACDPDCKIAYVNPYAYELTGYSKDEIGMALTPELLYDAQTAQKTQELMRETLKNGRAEGEAELVTKSGEKRNMHQSFFAIYNPDGTPKGVGLILRDITQMKQSQRMTNKMLEVLTDILDQLDALVYVTDTKTDELLFVNRTMRETFQVKGDIRGRTCWSVVQKGMEGRCPFCPMHKLTKDPDTPVEWEAVNSVTERCYQNRDSIIEWVGGKKAHMQYAIDVTDFREAQRKAQLAAEIKGRAEADARTQSMLDATPLAASFWDAEGNMLDCNMEAVRLFGLETKADYIEHFYDLNPEFQPDGESTADKAAKEIGAAFETGHRKFEWMYLTKTGEPLPVETTLVRVPWKGEYRLAAYSRDLREIRASEQQRREAEERSLEMEIQARTALAASEAKSQFLSNMSHEIRTPMNAILGMAELLTNEELNERQDSYVNDIKVSATSLLGIINDILDFSKIEAGKLQLVPVDYDFMQLLRNIDSMFAFTAHKKGINFKMSVQPGLPLCLRGDDIRLRQILVNILGNAVKFTQEGSVTLTVGTRKNMLCFDIADTGVGMREGDIPKIFNEFDQLDSSNNRYITGTGLGLSITRNLVSMMEGTIRVESEYGSGTTFHVEVPLNPGNPANLVGGKNEWKAIYAPDAKVLVVDDNDVNLNVAEGLLHLSGITAETALSGPEAIKKVEAKKYDLIFMDHMMPEMDGVETTIRLRELGIEVPIVALTANAVEGARDTLLQAGMDDYLSKPIDKAQLNQTLQKWLPKEKIKKAQKSKDSKAPVQLSSVLARVSEIEEIDVQTGLGRIAGQQAAYEKTLHILERRLPEVMEKLDAFLQLGDMKGFSIEVHGLKGSLANIGVMGIAKKAEELELRAKEDDIVFCREYLPALRTVVGVLHTKLRDALEAGIPGAKAKGAGDTKALARELKNVRDALEAFETDDALERLEAFSALDYGKEINGRLRVITRMVEEFEYDRAVEAIGEILGRQ